MMTIGVIGLSFSNPYTYAEMLPSLGARIGYVWDYYPDRAAEYADRYAVQVIDDYREYADLSVDGVLIFSPGADHVQHATPLVEARVPVFLDRPLSTDFRAAEALYARAADRGSLIMSCSALRYAPRFQALAHKTRAGAFGHPIVATAVVSHTMRTYMEIPRNRWHDRLDEGGGMIIDIGVHGMEVLHATLGPGAESIACLRTKVRFLDADSEDCAVLSIQFANGSLGVVQVICASEEMYYALDVWGTTGREAFNTTMEDAEMTRTQSGFKTCAETILDAFRRRVSPIPAHETLEITKLLCAARRAADTGRVIRLAEF